MSRPLPPRCPGRAYVPWGAVGASGGPGISGMGISGISSVEITWRIFSRRATSSGEDRF